MPGYWEPITSTVTDYVYTRFVAEMHNCWSNIAMVGLAAYGLRSAALDRLPARVSVGHLSLLNVGLGSIAFHATLKHSTQLLDEIPMLMSAAFFNWMLLSCIYPAHQRGLSIAIVSTVLLVSWCYVQLGTFAFFAGAYAFGQTVVLFELLYLTRPRLADDVSQQHNRQLARQLVIRGHICVLSAVLPWLLDNEFCAQLQSIRSFAPLPVLFEMHAIWHLLTGIGAHMLCTAAVIVTLNQDPIRVDPHLGIAYRVRRVAAK